MKVYDLLQECETLKDGVVTGDSIDWDCRLKLQRLLEQAILGNVDFCISRQAEQILWNVCFKFCIDFLQNKLKYSEANCKLQTDEDDAAFLAIFLKSSLGFFEQLLCKLAINFQLNGGVSGVSSNRYLGILETCLHDGTSEKCDASDECLKYLALFCLVHLGDICRYRKQLHEAENYYLNACRVCPTNGHPFNQLAILETCQFRPLSALYFYTRALYVENAFQLAANNIDKFFATFEIADSSTFNARPDFRESLFQFLASIHMADSIDTAEQRCKVASFNFKLCLQNGDISEFDCLHTFVVVIGSMYKINPCPDFNAEKLSDEKIDKSTGEFSLDETKSLILLIKFLQTIFEFLLRFKAVEFDKFGPIFKLFSCWFRCYPSVLKFDGLLGENSRFLVSFCEFLNKIQENRPEIENLHENLTSSDFRGVILPENEDLVGFLPLEFCQKTLVHVESGKSNRKSMDEIRLTELLTFGRFVVDFLADDQLIRYKLENEVGCICTFETNINPQSLKEDVCPEDSSNGVALTRTKLLATTKRQTKVLPLLGLKKDKKNLAAPTPVDRPPPRIKIAPAGSKVDMPLVGENVEKKEEPQLEANQSKPIFVEKSAPNQSLNGGKNSACDSALLANSSVSSKYELPPRFQAAKLKLALGGGATQKLSVGSAAGGGDPSLPSALRKSDDATANSTCDLKFLPFEGTVDALLPPLNLPLTFSRVPGSSRPAGDSLVSHSRPPGILDQQREILRPSDAHHGTTESSNVYHGPLGLFDQHRSAMGPFDSHRGHMGPLDPQGAMVQRLPYQPSFENPSFAFAGSPQSAFAGSHKSAFADLTRMRFLSGLAGPPFLENRRPLIPPHFRAPAGMLRQNFSGCLQRFNEPAFGLLPDGQRPFGPLFPPGPPMPFGHPHHTKHRFGPFGPRPAFASQPPSDQWFRDGSGGPSPQIFPSPLEAHERCPSSWFVESDLRRRSCSPLMSSSAVTQPAASDPPSSSLSFGSVPAVSKSSSSSPYVHSVAGGAFNGSLTTMSLLHEALGGVNVEKSLTSSLFRSTPFGGASVVSDCLTPSSIAADLSATVGGVDKSLALPFKPTPTSYGGCAVVGDPPTLATGAFTVDEYVSLPSSQASSSTTASFRPTTTFDAFLNRRRAENEKLDVDATASTEFKLFGSGGGSTSRDF